jgi:uncharacterized membrane protein (TIGR01666 family)
MNQQQEIKTFIYSQYFSDGLRIALSGVLPALLLAQFGQLPAGIIISLGALTVSIADGPGPVIHKRNGMLACNLFMFLGALITGFLNDYQFLMTIVLFLASFFFSMLNVYGTRASSVGTAALLIMILTIDQKFDSKGAIMHALYTLLGGLWYFILSLSLYQIRPYRVAQQTLGLCIREVAAYLKIKASFYDIDQDYDNTYKELIAQQVIVNQEQDAVREVLFKTRQIVKESTRTSRQLLLVFVDVVDLFEQTMATHYDYKKIRANFGRTPALKSFQNIILKIAGELENLSYYITSNEIPKQLHNFQPELEKLKAEVDKVEVELGISNLVLKKIRINVRNIVQRIQKIYTYYQQKPANEQETNNIDIGKFTSHQDFDLKLFKDNLTLNSSTFRFSLRVAIVMLIGYLIAQFLPLGHHSYWILLTILVILKPGFSLTKQRNYQRVIGTITGGIVGALVVIYVKDEAPRFILLMLFMIAAYSFQRLNYIVSVLFMTPYVLIMFSFIGLGNLSVARERIFDTFVGSIIAFTSSYLVFPSWEYKNLKGYMSNIISSNYRYLLIAAQKLSGKALNETEYKLVRKEVYVSSANLGSAFQRMLSEPKSKQKNIKEVHQLVVFNHILSSYTATLISSLHHSESRLVNPNHIKLIKKSLHLLCEAAEKLEDEKKCDSKEINLSMPENSIKVIEESPDEKLITEQLEFLFNVSVDIHKIILKLNT